MRSLHGLAGALALIALTLAGCPEDVDPPGAPEIVGFAAEPAQVIPGEPVTLSWETRNTSAVALSYGDGGTVDVSDRSAEAGQVDLVLEAPGEYTFTLVATGLEGAAVSSVSATASVTVAPAPAVITSFTAAPAEVTAGEAVVLAWALQGAVAIELSDGAAALDLGDVPILQGELTVWPEADTVYTLTAIGPADDEATAQVSVTVHPLPTVDELSADPTLSVPGDAVTISWHTTDATRVDLHDDQGAPVVESGDPSGTVTVHPEVSTTYTLTATGERGVATAELTVEVVPMVLSLTVEPTTVRPGDEVTVTWTAAGAKAAEVTGPDGFVFPVPEDLLPAGTVTTPVHTAGEIRLTLRSGELSDSLSVPVAITNAPRITAFSVSPSELTAGETVTVSWAIEGIDGAAGESVTLAADGNLVDLGSLASLGTAQIEVVLSTAGTATLELVAQNADGTAAESATALVHPVAAIDAFAVLPSRVPNGGTAHLSWETTGATSVRVTRNGDPMDSVLPADVDGAAEDLVVVDGTEYVLYAANALGHETASAPAIVGLGSPVIGGFTAEPARLHPGETLTFDWTNAGGTSLSVTDDATPSTEVFATTSLGAIASGSATITAPAADGTYVYTLLLTDEAGNTDTRTATVEVLSGPIIQAFEVTPGDATVGDPLTVSWSLLPDVHGQLPGLTLTDDLGYGYDLALQNPAADSLEITAVVAGTRVYTLTASWSGGAVTAERTVTLHDPAQIFAFAADPVVLDTASGPSASTLNWQTYGAVEVALFAVDAAGAETTVLRTADPARTAAGTETVSPLATTHYRLEAYNGAGSAAERLLTVQVDPPSVELFEARDASGQPVTDVLAGSPVDLVWQTSRADEVLIDPPAQWAFPGTVTPGGWVDTTGMMQLPSLFGSYVNGVPLPFPFLWDGAFRDTISISRCGFVAFADLTECHSSDSDFPDTRAPGGGVLAPYWDEWSTGKVKYGTVGALPHRRFVVSWETMDKNGYGMDLNWQLVLHESGDFELVYGTFDPAGQGLAFATGATGSAGWENTDGTAGHRVFHQQQNGLTPETSTRYDRPTFAASGSTRVYATETTSWSLQAVGANGVSSGPSVTVTVWPDLASTGPTFTATPDPAVVGDPVVFTWSVAGATGAELHDVTDPANPVALAGCASAQTGGTSAGTCTFVPSSEGLHRFELRYRNPVSSGRTPLSLQVQSRLEIQSFTATPHLLAAGESTTLQWTTVGATSATLTANGVPVDISALDPLSAQYVDTPAARTVYVLTIGDHTTRTPSAEVTVYVDAARVDALTATATQVEQGQPVTLGWQTTHADSVTVSPLPNPATEITGQAGAQFLDVSPSGAGTGTYLPLGDPNEGEKLLSFPAGFVFPFYGADRTSAVVTSDGFIGFDPGTTSTAMQFEMPHPDLPAGGVLAPFWDDLMASTPAHGVWYQHLPASGGNPAKLIIQWNTARFDWFSPDSELKFQIVLYADGSFDYRYGEMSTTSTNSTQLGYVNGSSATIGFENDDGTSGFTFSHDTEVAGGLSNRSWHFSVALPVDGSATFTPTETGTYRVCATGGGWTDCEEITVVVPQAGDVLITEIMPDPAVVDDAVGEWFELQNLSSAAIDLEGWTLTDAGTDSHTISTGSPFMIQPGELLVFAASGDTALNGGVVADYVYGADLTLANDADALVLTYGSTMIDTVAYDVSSRTDPWLVTSGASLELDPTWRVNEESANDAYVTAMGENVWCTAVDAYGSGRGNAGTPGVLGANSCRYRHYGYNPFAPAPAFIDITLTGTDLPGAVGDEAYDQVPGGLGFVMPFFGASVSELWVSSNGFVSFGSLGRGAWPGNFNLETATFGPAAGVVAPYWDDLTVVTDESGDVLSRVLYETRGRPGSLVTIVQWNAFQHADFTLEFSGSQTFQVQLHENGDIVLAVRDLDCYTGCETYSHYYDGGNSTQGIWDAVTGAGVQANFEVGGAVYPGWGVYLQYRP